jgi:hypothetical protein
MLEYVKLHTFITSILEVSDQPHAPVALPLEKEPPVPTGQEPR